MIESFLQSCPYSNRISLSSSTITFLNKTIDTIRNIAVPESPSLERTEIREDMLKLIPEVLQRGLTNTPMMKFSFLIGNLPVHVFMYDMHLRDWHHTFGLIYKWFSFIVPHCPSVCLQPLNIYLFLLKDKKKLPKKGDTIDVIHANTAFTYGCDSQPIVNGGGGGGGGGGGRSSITIFRKEEWFKVLMHETFHVLGLDFSTMPTDFSNGRLREMFKGLDETCDYRIYESYCEISAEILNVLFFVVLRPFSSLKQQTEMLKQALSIETTFSLFQWAKILDFYGMDYQGLIEGQHHYTEKTSVISYYALKSVGLFFVDDFIQTFWFQKSNLFLFEKTPAAIRRYCLFFEERYTRKNYIAALRERLKGTGSGATPELKNTLRMTLLDCI